MSRDYSLYLTDILESCEKVRDYLADFTFEEFSADGKTIDAVVRNLEIIGEAVKCVPPEMLLSQPQIEWKRIRRFRDIIAHYYFKVDLKVVWSITQEDLDKLSAAVSLILADIQKGDAK
jgi:uncharacterized protein with HEPN domain